MNKSNVLKTAAISAFALCAVAAPIASYHANLPYRAPVAKARVVPTVPSLPETVIEPTVIELDGITVVGQTPVKQVRIAAMGQSHCYDHTLEQGGSPAAPTVRVCAW